MRRAGSARFVCVAGYAPGFLHRENVDDFIFAKEDPNQSGHPIRITMFKLPKDGEAIIGCEFGGYRAPAGTWERIRPRDVEALYTRTHPCRESLDGGFKVIELLMRLDGTGSGEHRYSSSCGLAFS